MAEEETQWLIIFLVHSNILAFTPRSAPPGTLLEAEALRPRPRSWGIVRGVPPAATLLKVFKKKRHMIGLDFVAIDHKIIWK